MVVNAWWMYPMKPVRVDQTIFQKIPIDEYSMEKKMDGHRILLNQTNKINTWTRQHNRHDVPSDVMDQLRSLNLLSGTALDGEIWSITKRGGWTKLKPGECLITFWDIIRLGTKDLSKQPLVERQKILNDILSAGDHPSIRVIESHIPSLELCEQIEKDAKLNRKLGHLRSGYIHGVVLKKKNSPRRDNAVRSVEHPDWLKIVYSGIEGWEPD